MSTDWGEVKRVMINSDFSRRAKEMTENALVDTIRDLALGSDTYWETASPERIDRLARFMTMARTRWHSNMDWLLSGETGMRTRPFRGLTANRIPWLTDRVWEMAMTVMEELEWSLLPILADLMEEDGCGEEELLDSFRDRASEGINYVHLHDLVEAGTRT